MTKGRAPRIATLLLDGTVLAIALGPSGSAELYDPARGSWSMTGNMGKNHFVHTMTLLRDGTVLVTSGQGDETRPPRSRTTRPTDHGPRPRV